MDADVLDEDGNSVRNQVGELVVRSPWPGMTRGFWHDRERYLETYWSRWPNIWVHGDWAEIGADGLWYIRGRSDDTIKVAGKRLGPAEVESALVAHPDVAEAAAIGVPDEIKGEALVCFVVLKPGVADTAELRAALARASPPRWARRSNRRRWLPSPSCRRRATRRCSAASCAPSTSERTRVTCRRSRTRPRSTALQAVRDAG